MALNIAYAYVNNPGQVPTRRSFLQLRICIILVRKNPNFMENTGIPLYYFEVNV